MKVLVDEVPKCCSECIFHFGNFLPECRLLGTLHIGDIKDERCPLMGITEKNNSSSQKLSP